MRIITAAVIAATAVSGLAATAATAAFAAEGRLNDSQFIKAARCAGLAGADAEPFDALLKANERGRAGVIIDRAKTARSDAVRATRSAREGGKAAIAAELAGACAALVA